MNIFVLGVHEKTNSEYEMPEISDFRAALKRRWEPRMPQKLAAGHAWELR